jgi:hypothetical protein
MYPRNFNTGAAIWFAISACNAFAAVKIGNECHLFARNKIICSISAYEISGQFMTKYPRVIKVRLRTLKCMQVCTANANAPDLNDCVAGCNSGRILSDEYSSSSGSVHINASITLLLFF